MPPAPSQQQQQQQPHSRINVSELKAHIVKKLGPERSLRYFNCLNRFLSQKLGKAEFDKLCYLTFGRENLPLHNQLIGSILKNACNGRVPPPAPDKEAPQLVRLGRKRSPQKEGGPSPAQAPMPPSLIWGNGDVLPMSPRRSRSGTRDRRSRDRPSPLGRNGKTDPASHLLVADDEAARKSVMENGDWNSCDLERPMQHHQGPAEQPEDERGISLPPPAKRPRIKRSPPDGLVPVHSKYPVDAAVVEDEEVAEHPTAINSTRSPLQAPLGIPFCSASVGGARRALPVASSSGSFASSVDSGELSDTESLKKRMEQIAGIVGLNGVSMDCANLLNNALDTYLKGLIRSCVEQVMVKSAQEPIRHSMNKLPPHGNLINGVLPGHHMHIQSSGGSGVVAQEPKSHRPVSLLDFKVAMELKPQQLGEDWPVLLEKICLHPCEE